MNAKHTPGPWITEKSGRIVHIKGSDGFYVATVAWDCGEPISKDKPTLANRLDRASGEIARLRTINADLLEALQAVTSLCEAYTSHPIHNDKRIKDARAAIERATQK